MLAGIRIRQEQQECDADEDEREPCLDRSRDLTCAQLEPDRREHRSEGDDEDRRDELEPVDRHLPAEDLTVHLRVGIGSERSEDLLAEDQKTTQVMKKGMNASTRERSSAFVCGLTPMTMK